MKSSLNKDIWSNGCFPDKPFGAEEVLFIRFVELLFMLERFLCWAFGYFAWCKKDFEQEQNKKDGMLAFRPLVYTGVSDGT